MRTAFLRFTLLLSFQLLLLNLFGQNKHHKDNLPDPKPNTYINDFTSSLSDDQIYNLNVQIKALEEQTTVQMAVILINHLPADMTIEDYARNIGNKWRVGINHNGIVYVAVLKEHKQRLEIARNLEGEIPDITASEIIDQLKLDLRQEDYYGALTILIREVGNHLGIATQSQNDSTTENTTSNLYASGTDDPPHAFTDFEKAKAKYDYYSLFAIWGLVLAGIGFCIWAWIYKKKYVQINTRNGVYIGVGSSYYASTHGGDDGTIGYGGSGGGGGGFGGFGGGGGGGFGGGGASGGW